MNEANRYPLDFENLKKGDVVPEKKIADILQLPIGSTGYQFGVIELCKTIEREKTRLNDPVTCVQRKNQIVLLTDEEASHYNDKYFYSGLKRLKSGLMRLLNVDTNKLSAETTKEHQRRIEINGKTYLGAIFGRRGKLNLPAVDRKTPLMK